MFAFLPISFKNSLGTKSHLFIIRTNFLSIDFTNFSNFVDLVAVTHLASATSKTMSASFRVPTTIFQSAAMMISC